MAPGPEQTLNKFCWMNEDKEGMQITFTEDTGLDLRAVMLDDKSSFPQACTLARVKSATIYIECIYIFEVAHDFGML